MPIVIDDADGATATDGRTQPSMSSPMNTDPANAGTPAAGSAITRNDNDGRRSPSAESVPDVLPTPATTASTQRIDHHRSTWPMVSLMANVVMVTAAVAAGIMHAMSLCHGGLY
eukprot:5289370-Pleurochrysis_carterae.AAC.2